MTKTIFPSESDLNSQTNSNHHIPSLDWARVIALLAIITIHAKPFSDYPLIAGEPWIALLLNQCSRFAVPLFFLIAGYFIAPKLIATPRATFIRYSLPLMKVWLAWSLIYLFMPFNLETVFSQGYLADRQPYWQYLLSIPLNSLFEGGLVHLWYIPALVCAMGLLALLHNFKLQHALLATAVGLYIYGLAAGSYQPIFELSAPIFTRNGPFLSTLMVTIGFIIRQQQSNERSWFISNTKAVTIAVIGMLLHLSEAYFLRRYDIPFNTHDFLIGTPFWAYGLFILLLNKPQLGKGSALLATSKDVLGIYLVHLLVVIYLFNLKGLLAWNAEGMGLLFDTLIVPVAFLISLLVVRLIEKTPMKRLLLR
ncbi:acyltransferase [Photobacterium kagoshimensis]|uniref:acyltransferase n=1 Tax=Photobacterium kagoshimensis TaxID=2910242 RepID=UPI003D0CA246